MSTPDTVADRVEPSPAVEVAARALWANDRTWGSDAVPPEMRSLYLARGAAVVAALDEWGAQQDQEYTDRLLAETMFDGMDVDDGVRVKLRMAAELAGGMVQAFKTWLDTAGADNYVESDIFDRETGGRYVVTVHRPGGLSPHQLRQAAEAERDTALAELAALRAAQATQHGTAVVEEFGVRDGSGMHPIVRFCCPSAGGGHQPGPHTHHRRVVTHPELPAEVGQWAPLDEDVMRTGGAA